MSHKAVDRTLDVMAWGMLALLAASLVLTIYSPIYYDDARYALGHLRGGYDGWGAVSSVPFCGSSFFTPYPASMLPGRYLSWFFYSMWPDMWGLRVQAALVFLAWLGGLSWVMQRHLLPSWRWHWCAAAAGAFAAVGAVPLLWVQLRPDVGLLAVVTLFAVLPLVLRGRVLSLRSQLMLLAVLMLVCSWYFSAHAKSLLYLPLVLVSLLSLPLMRRIKLVAVSVVVLMAVQALPHWHARISCPEDLRAQVMRRTQAMTLADVEERAFVYVDRIFVMNPSLEQSFYGAAHGLGNPQTALSSKVKFGAMMLGAALMFMVPLSLSMGAMFVYNTMYSYIYVKRVLFSLPHKWRLKPEVDALAEVADLMLAMLAISVMFMLLRWLATAVRSMHREDIRDVGVRMPVVLAFCMLAQSSVQIAKNFYESPFVLPAVGLLCLLVMAMPVWGQVPWRSQRKALVMLFLVVIASQGVLHFTYWPKTLAAYAAADAEGMMDGNSVLQSPLAQAEVAKRVAQLAQRCDIPAGREASRVLVDNITYMPMREQVQPLWYRVNFGEEPEDPPENIMKMLKDRGAKGAIVRCVHVPEPLKAAALEDGGLCCLSREAIEGVGQKKDGK